MTTLLPQGVLKPGGICCTGDYLKWVSVKIHSSERFDLLGNSLATFAGATSPSRAGEMISWRYMAFYLRIKCGSPGFCQKFALVREKLR
jgi:hypothetical protein